MQVKATREGLLGHDTSSGYVLEKHVPCVALPSRKALYKCVRLINPKNSATCDAVVLDVGPWNVEDDDYVFGGKRPQAESGTDCFGRTTNHAGIDLGEYVWNKLGMIGNDLVEWRFLV